MPLPFDHAFKLLADGDPRAALAAFAGIPLEEELEVQTLDRELNIATLRADNLYRCRRPDQEFVVHFEAVSRYKPEALERQSDYIRAIVAKYKLPCRSYLLLLTEGGVPSGLPRYLESRFGDYQGRTRLRAVRLWRVPARHILRMGRLSLLPWTALMAGSQQELAEAARRLAQRDEKGLTAQMALLLGLRYGKKELFEERLASMTTEEIIQDSYFYHWILEKGETAGIEKGMERVLVQLLTDKFGPLPAWAQERLDRADANMLAAWARKVLTAQSLEDCLAE